MSATLSRLGAAFERLLGAPESLSLLVGPAGPQGELTVPSEGDGRWVVGDARGRVRQPGAARPWPIGLCYIPMNRPTVAGRRPQGP